MSTVEALPPEIRSVMLPVTRGQVLVPSTELAEVITYARPDMVADSPRWLLGRVGWRGWRLPVVAFALWSGVADAEPADNTRVAILKALGGNPRLPFFGILCHGFPRLTLVHEETLLASDAPLPPSGVRAQVQVHDDLAWIPDLAAIEDALLAALPPAG
ncbi:MAG TPA: chemotaxis protein CheW [Rhodanobacteraceae bacterium]